ncbi:MAG TPA: Maf family protein [Rhizomicrobium sp.]|nr:Maf family protein [Rhizomicrobium sp.]
MSLVLASASASRAGLLRAAGVEFSVHPADLDEAALMASMAGASPAYVALALARAKAMAVSCAHPGALVLGGDSVIGFGGRHLSKCADMAAARALLASLRGQEHMLVSAAALARDGRVVWSHVSPCRMAMRDFSDAFLDGYLAAAGAAILSSVGCYHYEGRGAQLFEQVEGDYFAVLGLPLLPLLAALRREGVLKS